MKKYVVGFMTILLCAGVLKADLMTAENARIGGIATNYYADAQLRSGLSPENQNGVQLRGYYSSATLAYSPVLVFVLPDLQGGTILSANLTAYGTTVLPNTSYYSALDLYGLRWHANTGAISDTSLSMTDVADSKDYSASNNGTGIMDNMFPNSTNASLNGTYSIDDAAQIALGDWLQAQYDGGAQAGDYVFLRLTPDRVDTAIFGRGWNVNSADASSNQPVLQITTIPEPATIGMLGLGAVTAVLIRRSRS